MRDVWEFLLRQSAGAKSEDEGTGEGKQLLHAKLLRFKKGSTFVVTCREQLTATHEIQWIPALAWPIMIFQSQIEGQAAYPTIARGSTSVVSSASSD
jgi:hypothetical protein